jgi:hypothetical protein
MRHEESFDGRDADDDVIILDRVGQFAWITSGGVHDDGNDSRAGDKRLKDFIVSG